MNCTVPSFFALMIGCLNVWRSRATDVERTHRQLRAGLADGLRGDDADRFAELHELAGRQIASVAMRADAALAFASQHRADLELLDADLLDRLAASLRRSSGSP